MKECPKCKCQVASGVALCPYCGTTLPVEDTVSNPQATYIQPPRVPFRQNTEYPYYQNGVGRGYPVAYPHNSAMNYNTWDGTGYCGVPVYYPVPEQTKKHSTTELVLLIALICMFVVNVFELVALFLLLF